VLAARDTDRGSEIVADTLHNILEPLAAALRRRPSGTGKRFLAEAGSSPRRDPAAVLGAEASERKHTY
jgi:hypothetical protein